MPMSLVIPPTRVWGGYDGPWSSFALRIGSPWQHVSVFVSTKASQIWAVLRERCTSSDPPDCKIKEAGVFHPNSSASWVGSGNYALDVEQNLNYTGMGTYGFDTVALGWMGIHDQILEHQVVAGITTKDFNLNQIGLAATSNNSTDYNDLQPSFLSTLRGKDLIPSLSFAYTAGAQYKIQAAPGSLILGGYDTSRISPNAVSFNCAEDRSRDLIVGIQSITTAKRSSNSVISLMSEGVFSIIDPAASQIWLPITACQEFERAFGISYDPITELYLVNNSLRATLLNQEANVTFKLGNTISSQPTVDIVLPYASFDRTASYPLVQNSTRYFPIRRATNKSQYTLGRTFLQEAYLIVDYERNNFSVSQCIFDDESKQDIITIPSLNVTTNHTTSDLQTPPSNHSFIPAGTIAGIVTGAVLGTLFVAAFSFILVRRFRKRPADSIRWREELPASTYHPKEIDGRKLYADGLVEIPGDQPSLPEMSGDQISLREMAVGPTSPREMLAFQTSPVELGSDK